MIFEIGLFLFALACLVRFSNLKWCDLKNIWLTSFLLILIFASPYTDLTQNAGPAEKTFSIFHHIGGVISVWELVLVFSVLVLSMRILRARRTDFISGKWFGIPLLIGLFFCGLFFGWLYSRHGFGVVGTQNLRPLILAATGPAFLFTTIIIIQNEITDRRRFFTLLRVLRWLFGALIFYIGLRAIGILFLNVTTMSYYGFPVLLYDRMLLLYPALFFLFQKLFNQQPLQKIDIVLFISILFIILVSTRRLNILLLFIGFTLCIIVVFTQSDYSTRIGFKRVGKFVAAAAAVLFVFQTQFSELAPNLHTAISTFNLWSEIGQKQSGNMRLTELENLTQNLSDKKIAFFTGTGIGSNWHAFSPQPVDPLTRRLAGKRSRYTAFHLPYISLFYRFGVIFTGLFIFWLSYYSLYLWRGLRTAPKQLHTLGVAFIIFLVIFVPLILDSINPTGWICCGVVAALVEKILHLRGHHGFVE